MTDFRTVMAVFVASCAASAVSYAQIPTVDEQGACAHRVSGYVSGLEAALVADPNNAQARSELTRINNLSSNLIPCDKLKRIPALLESDRALNYATETLKSR